MSFVGINPHEGSNVGYHAGIAVLLCFSILTTLVIAINGIRWSYVKYEAYRKIHKEQAERRARAEQQLQVNEQGDARESVSSPTFHIIRNRTD